MGPFNVQQSIAGGHVSWVHDMQGIHSMAYEPRDLLPGLADAHVGNIGRADHSSVAIEHELPALPASSSNSGHQTAAKLQRLQQEINLYQEQVPNLHVKTRVGHLGISTQSPSPRNRQSKLLLLLADLS